MSKPTPTPWRYQGELSMGLMSYPIYTESGKYGHPATATSEQDAAFIVRAVNAHEELLQLCKWSLSCMLHDNTSLKRDLEQAITRAEGRDA